MKRYNGGSAVKGGYYWNLTKWEIVAVRGEAGALEAPASERFLSVPLPLLFVLAPIMGALYAIFLPFIGFAMAIYAVGRKLGLVGSKAVDEVAATMAPTWQPGEAHFAGKPEDEKKGEEKKNEKLDQLEKEVEEKKGEEKK